MRLCALRVSLLVGSLGLLAGPGLAVIPTVSLEVISEEEIVAPVGIVNAGDGSNRLFVVDQRGTIHVIENDAVLPTPFLDIGSLLVPERADFDERGLLGLVFHRDFGTTSDKFYTYYSAPRPGGDPNDPVNPVDHQSVISEWSVSVPGANTADPSSERILLTFDQPQFNHDAGWLGFGADGMLYIATGDGGGAGDNEPGHVGGGAGDPSGGLGNSQSIENLLGKILRIDPAGTNGPGGQYGIPGDNPFAGDGGTTREEIYAYGLRNPWRASFDDGPGGTGRLFVADVGQDFVEEINLVENGGNYGWRIMEGTFDFDNTVAPNPVVPLLDPIAQYQHPGAGLGLLDVGLSVTGGVVYRGAASPPLDGVYLFGDWSNGFQAPAGTLLGLEETAPDTFELSVLDVVGGNPLSEFIQAFGLDESGEPYMATKQTLAVSELGPLGEPTGKIYRIVPEPSGIALALVGALTLVGVRRRRRDA